MKINRDELLKILEAVSPAIGKKDMQEQLSGFLFTGDDIVTYNEQLCIKYPFETDFVCAISSEEFYKVLKGIEEETVDINEKGESLTIESVKTRAKLNTFLEDEGILKSIKSINDGEFKWKTLPEEFIKALSLCLFSVSKDISQGVLTCVCIGKGKLFSSDNYRISMYELEEIDDSVLLPLGPASELVKFNVKEYCRSDSWIHFKTDNGVIFSSRIVNEEYPDCLPFFKLEGGSRLRMPKALKGAVDAITFFAEGENDLDKKITVSFKEDSIFCTGEGRNGWVEKKVPIKYKKDDISFIINPVFFSQILNSITSVTLTKEKALFKSGNFKHVIALPME